METAYLCPENDQLEVPISFIHINRINRTHKALSIDYTLNRPIDDKIEATLLVEKLENSGWLKVPSVPWQKNPCEYGRRIDKEGSIRFLKTLGLVPADACPIPGGNYSVKNYVLELPHSTPFWAGRFRCKFVMRIINTKKNIYCVMFIINIVEKVD